LHCNIYAALQRHATAIARLERQQQASAGQHQVAQAVAGTLAE